MSVNVEQIAKDIYAVYGCHRATQRKLAELGCRVELILIMFWLDIITTEQYIRFKTNG